jgi:hypothetical protein
MTIYRVQKATRLLLSLTALGMLCIGTLVSAQQPDFGSPDTSNPVPLVLIVTPENPKPNTLVTVEVATSETDLNQATIEWLNDGRLSESGLGKITHTVRTGPAGSAIRITAVVRPSDGSVHEESITLRPATLDLIWESQSTVPPFYKGKALYTQLNQVKVIAMPELIDSNGDQISSNDIKFTWMKGSEVLGDFSGFGRNTLTLVGPVLRPPLDISATVESRDGVYSAEGTIEIDVFDPTVLVYENSPLYGVLFNTAIAQNFSLTSQEVSFEAYPYFFGQTNRNKLTYQWSVNGTVSEGFKSSYLTLRNVSGQAGSGSIALDVTDGDKLVYGANTEFGITFGAK